jgi:hypothetical protein
MMAEALHIIRKDVRQLRWLLLVWVVLLVARVAAWSFGLAPSTEPTYAFLLQRSTGTIESLLLLVLAFISARLIHGEPLVGWNAFWMTRPYSRTALLVAKLLLAIAVFILLPLISDTVIMAMYRVGVHAQFEAATSFVTSYTTWMLLAIGMAVLTPSLGAFVLATIAGFTALSLLTVVTGAVSVFLREPFDPLTVLFREFNPAPGIAAALVIDVAMIVVIAYQYRQRRWPTAAAVAAAGLAISLAVPFLPFAEPVPPDPGRWAQNPSTSPVVVERRSETQPVFIDRSRKRMVYARVRLQGMPQHYDANYTVVDSALTFPDGTRVTSRQRESIWKTLPETDASGSFGTRSALLDGMTLIDANRRNVERWTGLIALSQDQYERFRGTSGRLDATLKFRLMATRRRAMLPLEAGAAYAGALSRLEIVRIEHGPEGVWVTIRRWRAYSPLDNRRYPNVTYALQNTSRREALPAVTRRQLPVPAGTTSNSGSAGVPVLSFMGTMSGGLRHDGLAMDAEQLLFPDRIERDKDSVTLDPKWFDGVTLAVLESSYVGIVTRSVTVEDFMIPAE